MGLFRWSSATNVLYLLTIWATSHALRLLHILFITSLLLTEYKWISCLHRYLIHPLLVLLRILKVTMLQLFKFASSWHIPKLFSPVVIHNCICLSWSLAYSSIWWRHGTNTSMPMLICLRLTLGSLYTTHLHWKIWRNLLMPHLGHNSFAHNQLHLLWTQ